MMTEQRQTDLLVDDTYEHMKRLAASYLQLESTTVTLSPTVLVHEAYIAYDPTVSVERCLWILRQTCGAIEEAHDIGLIHRDIKPQNTMICRKGQLMDLVKVVDFGLAKTMADNIAKDVTATRVLIGTPGFIAPERLETPWIAEQDLIVAARAKDSSAI